MLLGGALILSGRCGTVPRSRFATELVPLRMPVNRETFGEANNCPAPASAGQVRDSANNKSDGHLPRGAECHFNLARSFLLGVMANEKAQWQSKKGASHRIACSR